MSSISLFDKLSTIILYSTFCLNPFGAVGFHREPVYLMTFLGMVHKVGFGFQKYFEYRKIFLKHVIIEKSIIIWENELYRKFLMFQIIIKRIHNTIRIAGIIQGKIMPSKIYFLTGYSEELLSNFLKCPVKLEFQSVTERKDVVYRYI